MGNLNAISLYGFHMQNCEYSSVEEFFQNMNKIHIHTHVGNSIVKDALTPSENSGNGALVQDTSEDDSNSFTY